MTATKASQMVTRSLAAACRSYRQARTAVEKGDPGLVARRLSEALLRVEAAEQAMATLARKTPRAAS